MIFVTGGAGFIGSNFVLDWLAQSDEPVINYDKLTYAGTRNTLAALKLEARHPLVRGDICDRAQGRGWFRHLTARAGVRRAAGATRCTVRGCTPRAKYRRRTGAS